MQQVRKYTRVRARKRLDGSVRYLPGTFDWRANDTLNTPPLSCRWGPVMMSSRSISRQRLYLSYKITDNERSPYIRESKTIRAPGKVGRIREFPKNRDMVATLSDSRVYIWDVKARCKESAIYGTEDSCPDVELSGHEDKAEFAALALSHDYCVLSGGKDKKVSLWNIQDYTTLAAAGSVVFPRNTFSDHTGTVEDVQFHPSSLQEFCSVGDDSCLIFWDARTSNKSVAKVNGAHGGAIIYSVDWNRSNEAKILTGSDKLVGLFDRRFLATPVMISEGGHCVQWCPGAESMVGSSSEDGTINVWNFEMDSGQENTCTPHRFKQYAGHRGGKIVDFHWNELDPWTIASLSDDSGTHGGGVGKLQIWRLSDQEYEWFVRKVIKDRCEV